MSFRFFKAFSLILITSIISVSCSDSAVFDDNKNIDRKGWSFHDKADFNVKIETPGIYNVFLNLRHTDDYRYSNIFLLMSVQAPGQKEVEKRRIEVKLAEQDGHWLGNGSGNLYARRVFLTDKINFLRPGEYHFELEQNMRDEPLLEIADIGIRIEKK
ncbi:gliding motility lipoprotein GldH [Solitalea koreensis]|uniref:Gliding motility-associated lipoprotein GldH n=1 Tax=Solitalea koreensis TaxID=543615 RepID=A0A521CNX5_9SPHI|nr:gliding motility lipoprotein GldH [Solitalea koreensis]SMO60451.1 gliding motility-associated lipoprotein GldH [Solitalea koreensis]